MRLRSGAARVAHDGRAHLPLGGAGRAAQQYLQAVDPGGMIGHGGVASGAPVAKRMAGAGTDDERAHPLGDHGGSGALRVLRDGQVPAQQALVHAQGCRETEKTVQNVFTRVRGDAPVGEQPLQLPGPRPIKSEFERRADLPGDETRPQRQLHVQQHIEATPPQAARQLQALGAAGMLVDGDKLHLRNRAHEPGFQRPDHPGEAGIRPGALQGAQHGQDMAGITNGRES